MTAATCLPPTFQHLQAGINGQDISRLLKASGSETAVRLAKWLRRVVVPDLKGQTQTQAGGANGLGPVHTPKVEYFPPGAISGNTPSQVIVDEIAAPAPVATSPEPVEDKSQVMPFNFNGSDVRASVDDKGNPWFVAKDVCDVLGLSNVTEALRGLDDDETNSIRNPEVNRGNPNLTIVSQSGLIALTLRSRKPEARKFRKWVTSEVVPAILNHKGYLTPEGVEEALTNPDFIIGLATKLKEERAKSAELAVANARVTAEKVRIAEENIALEIEKYSLAKENAAMAPKVALHDALMEADGAVEMDEAAKTLQKDFPGMGRTKLFSLLRRKGVMMRGKWDQNVPTQAYMNRDYFRVVQKSYVSNGRERVYPQTYVKPAGMAFLHGFLQKTLRKVTPIRSLAPEQVAAESADNTTNPIGRYGAAMGDYEANFYE